MAIDLEFVYVPGVTTELGDTEGAVRFKWSIFRNFNREFSDLRLQYTGSRPAPGAHARCTQEPLDFARVELSDGCELHRSLLSPEWWRGGRHEHAGPGFTRPGFIPFELDA